MSNIATQLNNTLGTNASNNINANKAATEAAASTNPDKDKASLLGTTDQFLNILLAQLKYQDPTEPMKGTEFIDSISRLSSVEQSINSNKYLEQIATLLGNGTNLAGSAVSYLDKHISFNSSQIELKDGMTGFSYDLPTEDTPKGVTMLIKNAKGEVVVSVQGTNKAGVNSVKWDGTDNDGNKVADGLYTVSVQYPDPENKNLSIEVATYTDGVVKGADFTGTTPMLTVDGGIQIPLSAVRSITSGTTSAASN